VAAQTGVGVAQPFPYRAKQAPQRVERRTHGTNAYTGDGGVAGVVGAWRTSMPLAAKHELRCWRLLLAILALLMPFACVIAA